MSAGGVPKTCKSNGEHVLVYVLSGERVSNALVTCPEDRDNSSKELLIPNVFIEIRCSMKEWIYSLREGPASHQLVGKVMAYQGDDG